MPSVTGFLCAAPSDADHHHRLCCRHRAVKTAESGTFNACATVVPVIDTFTGVPTLSLPDLLSIFSHTSTVVLPGRAPG